MSALPNTRHERFCQARVKGMSIDAAYVEAGYSQNSGSAARLHGNADIQARIAELQSKAVKKTEITVEWILERLTKAYDMAEAQQRPDRSVLALNSIAKITGLIIDRSEATVTHKHDDRVAKRTEVLARRREERQDERRDELH